MNESWHVGMADGSNANVITDESDRGICQVYAIPFHTRIEDVDPIRYGEGLEHAHLLAAAPVLLRELKGTVQDLEFAIAIASRNHSSRAEAISLRLHEVRAAIAKAEPSV